MRTTVFALCDNCRLKLALYIIRYWMSCLRQGQARVHFAMESNCKWLTKKVGETQQVDW